MSDVRCLLLSAGSENDAIEQHVLVFFYSQYTIFYLATFNSGCMLD